MTATVILLQVLCFAAPAVASTNSLTLCNKGARDVQQLPSSVLKPVSGNDAEESSPAAKLTDDASTREFLSSRIELESRSAPSLPQATPRELMSKPRGNVIVPGILAETLARYRKQMYRKDI